MSSQIEFSNLIGLSPNKTKLYSSVLSANNSRIIYTAFSCDHIIYIVNRENFGIELLKTPDPKSKVYTLTFCGDKYLFCSNDNEKCYVFLRKGKEFEHEPIYSGDFKFKPSSISANSKHIFFIDEYSLFHIEINQLINGNEPELLTDMQTHHEVCVSPCGRAIALYTKNGPSPLIWFAPFSKKKIFEIPQISNLIDFRWGLSESLCCVIASKDGTVRIWIEAADGLKFRCSSWFKCNAEISYVSFCNPVDEWHQPKNFHQASSEKHFILPNLNIPNCLLIVGLKEANKNTLILENNQTPKINEVALATINCDPDSFCISCDLRYRYSKNGSKKFITPVYFSSKELKFFEIEANDTDINISTPFKITFFKSKIKNILSNNIGELITIMDENKIINWNNNTVETFKEVERIVFDSGYFEINDDKIKYIKKDAVISSFQLDFLPDNYFYKLFPNEIMFIFTNDGKSIVLFYFNNSFTIINCDELDYKISKANIHSTDLFLLSSSNRISGFMFKDSKFVNFSSINIENNLILFLPNPRIMFAVSTNNEILFYYVSKNSFELNNVIPSLPLTSFNYVNNCLLASTENSFFKLYLPQSIFKDIIPLNSDYVFLLLFRTS